MKAPVTIATQSYESYSKPFGAQRLVNMFYEPGNEETKTASMLMNTPGLVEWTTVGTGPIRAARKLGDNLIVASGESFYKVDQFGASTLIGTVSGLSGLPMPVSDNGIDCVFITDMNEGYRVNAGAFTKITDSDFPLSIDVTFLDSRILVAKKNSGQFNGSDSLDAAAWDPLNFATAEASPDNLVSIEASLSEILLLGERTSEIWYNAGTSGFPFARVSGGVIQRGGAATKSAVSAFDTIFFLGDDRSFYIMINRSMQKISTYAIDSELEKYAKVDDAYSFAYSKDGHKFFVCTFPAEKKTWTFDLTTQKFHERETVNKGMWRPSCHEYFANKNIVGDYFGNKLYYLDRDVFTDASERIDRLWTAGTLYNGESRIRVHEYAIDFEGGVGKTTGQGNDPKVMIEVSKDGGITWSNEIQLDIGKKGKYDKRTVLRRLGIANEFMFRHKISDPVKPVVLGAYVKAEPE
jgi:hypothetical protein